jgi:hypothetical protein
MQRAILLFPLLAISFSACGSSQPLPVTTYISTNGQKIMITETAVAASTLEYETFVAIPSFTPLLEPCSTPSANELNEFINRSITFDDNGKTFQIHVTSRFWIYLDERIYPLRDLLNAIPEGLIGYISNGSIRGPQCYPVMFEAVRDGKGLLKIKDFQIMIIVDNSMPESPLPLH